jgi:hypothetical protein
LRLKTTFFVWAGTTIALILLLTLPAFFALVGPLHATKGTERAVITEHEDHHAVIAIPCPYAPYFGVGQDTGSEWQLIAEALRSSGREPQNIYVSYDEAIQYAEVDYIAGIWICGGMQPPDNDLYASAPLLPREFVVVTLGPGVVDVEGLAGLKALAVAIHPDVFHVLQPQLRAVVDEGQALRRIPNHLLLTSLLSTGQIDALITERSVFEHNIKELPEIAQPEQPFTFHALFDPVSPRILFRDRDLRDAFDLAWRKLNRGDQTALGMRKQRP